MRQLEGRIALVTGASRGIGHAGTLAETVALIESAGGHAIALAADLENPVERDALVARTVEVAGGLDILVNNAGFADHASTVANCCRHRSFRPMPIPISRQVVSDDRIV
ncbi:MAG TPA: SDR family NAD(P)-dependent oxidoreductase [Pseudomonadales bacterium]|nr:SDR family NAD(P)-dependent oxidoreductase [Pseudomonadales bacterium]HND14510.1 SDR family NAD(P)-dependent oxidoreductase [Pseudomonadales bacterium]